MSSRTNDNTVFLTQQEADRIKHVVNERLGKCAETRGQAREARDVGDSFRQATGASLMADMGGASQIDTMQAGSLPALGIARPYVPCRASLKDLASMTIAELRMDTHHHGRRLTVRRTGNVVILTARSWTMVQDEDGEDIERLEVCLHRSRHGKDVLESAKNFVIKEPYFTLTESGEPTIMISHPTDLVAYGDGVAINPISDATNEVQDAAAAEKLARTCKDAGNEALKKQDLQLAHTKYSQGLYALGQAKIVPAANHDLARDIHRNRAHVNNLLRQFDQAISDAKDALIAREDEQSKELDSKAYLRAGTAAYNLGHFEEAKSYYTEQLNLANDDKIPRAYLAKTEARLREQRAGEYDFRKIKARLSKAAPRADAASWDGNTEVKDSAGRGRGLFATHDISSGQLIMCEKASCVVWGHESEALTAVTYDTRDDKIRVSPVGLTRAIVQYLLNNPSQIDRVTSLCSGDDQVDRAKVVSMVDGGPIVDTFRIHDIMSRNAFGPGNQYGADDDVRKASTGLWIRAAYINHSCVSNATKEYVGDLMLLRATRPISTGEEIFHSYDESSDYDARQAALTNTWGFQCSCALCKVEKAEDASVRAERQRLVVQADEFVRSTSWTGAKSRSIIRAKHLAKSIDETYSSKKHGVLPRFATRTIQAWLSAANQR